VVGFIIEYVVVPKLAANHKALHELAAVNPLLPLTGLLLEILAQTAYFELTRSLIPKSSDPGLATVSRIQLATLALSHCIPGGSAAGNALGYRLFTRAGVGSSDAGFALATQDLGSAVVLIVIFMLALVVSLPLYGFRLGYLLAAICGLLTIAAVAGLVISFTNGSRRAMKLMRALGAKLPFLQPDTLPRVFGQLVTRARVLSRDRRQLSRALFFASANWFFDAGALFVFVGTFGRWINPVALLVAYGVANILGAIPITPGGLGVIEVTLSGVLVGFGEPKAVVILGVVGWRLVNFWLPIPVGGATYLSLRVHPPAGNQTVLADRRAVWRGHRRWFVGLFKSAGPAPAASRRPADIEPIEDAAKPSPAEGGSEVAGTGELRSADGDRAESDPGPKSAAPGL
jgi:putative heme transporter